MRFVVIGTGGVGAFFGGKLAVSGADVWFLARGKHLEAMRRHGLELRTTSGDFTIPPGKMTDNANEITGVDVVLFCVKSYDSEGVAKQLTPMLKDDTMIITLQNGIDTPDTVRCIVRGGTVLAGMTYIYSIVTAPGVVTESGGSHRLVFDRGGPAGGRHDAKTSAIRGRMLKAGMNAEISDDIITVLWKKLIFISAVGGLTALTRLTLGELLDVSRSRQLMAEAMKEAMATAEREGVKLETGFLERTFESMERLKTGTRSSLYHDLVNGKPLELEALSGKIVQLGAKHGIPTPIHDTIYSGLLPYHVQRTKSLSYSIPS